jgi:hypothetical protein
MPQLRALICGLPFLIAAPICAFADDRVSPSIPIWSVVGSLESSYTDNAFLTPSDRQSDVYANPDITIRADGNLTSEVYYRLYARMEFDAFSEETGANSSVARVGARLSRDIGGWTGALAYENRYSYGGIFEERFFTGHDVIGSIGRSFDLGWVNLSPGGLLTYRFADVAESQRFRMEIWLGIEVPLDEKWAIVSEPFYESFWFTDGANSGREDQVYSVSLGLQYALTDNASLTTEVIYENGSSNRAGLDYEFIEVGPRLDFAF